MVRTVSRHLLTRQTLTQTIAHATIAHLTFAHFDKCSPRQLLTWTITHRDNPSLDNSGTKTNAHRDTNASIYECMYILVNKLAQYMGIAGNIYKQKKRIKLTINRINK